MTSDVIDQTLTKLEEANPFLCQRIPLMASIGGKPITAVRLADVGVQQRIPVLFTAGMHAREWAPPDALVSFVGKLLWARAQDEDIVYPEFESAGVTYSKDPSYTIPKETVTDIFGRFELIVLPLVNPDGRDFSLAGTVWREINWRKNRRDLQTTNIRNPWCVGIDINRNFPIAWEHETFYRSDAAKFVAISDDKCDQFLYKGPGAKSEIETQNIIALADKYVFEAYVDIHSIGRNILYPWSFEQNQITEEEQNFHNSAFDGKRDGLLGDTYGEYIGPEMSGRLTLLADAMKTEIENSAGGNPVAKRRSKYSPMQTVYAAPLAGGDPRSTFIGAAPDYIFSLQYLHPERPSCVAFTLEVGQETDQNAQNPDDDDGGLQPLYKEHFPKIEREVHAGLFALLANL